MHTIDTRTHSTCMRTNKNLNDKLLRTKASLDACLDKFAYMHPVAIKNHSICMLINRKLNIKIQWIKASLDACLDKNVCIRPIKKHPILACLKEHRLRLHVNQPKHFFPTSNTLGGPQLNLWKGEEKEVIRSTDLNISLKNIYFSLSKCVCNRMTTSSTVAATTRKLFEQTVEPMDTITNSKK